MQWIVDIIRLKLAAFLQGKIFLWSGAIVDIPVGWALCNGALGTPDLRDKFIIGAGNSYAPDDAGGGNLHFHSYEISGFFHTLPAGSHIEGGLWYKERTGTHFFAGLTGSESTLSPYYTLAYIMKL